MRNDDRCRRRPRVGPVRSRTNPGSALICESPVRRGKLAMLFVAQLLALAVIGSCRAHFQPWSLAGAPVADRIREAHARVQWWINASGNASDTPDREVVGAIRQSPRGDMYDSLYQVSMDLLSVATAVDANEFAFDHEKVWDAVNDVESELDALATPVLNVADVQSRIAHLYVLKVISDSITTLAAKATAHVKPTVLFLDSLGALLRCIFLLDRILTTSVPETAVITSAYAFDHRQAGSLSTHHDAFQGPAIALPTTHVNLEGLTSVNQIACNLGVAFASCVHARPAVLQAAESLLGRFRARRTRTVAQLHHIRNLPENRMPAIGAGCTTRRERVFRPTQQRIVQWSIEQKKEQASRIRATYAATLSMIDSDIEFVQTCRETFSRLPDCPPSSSNGVLAMVVSSIQCCDAQYKR